MNSAEAIGDGRPVVCLQSANDRPLPALPPVLDPDDERMDVMNYKSKTFQFNQNYLEVINDPAGGGRLDELRLSVTSPTSL